MTTPFIVCAAITTISALVSLGFSVAAVRGAGNARTLAFYAVARSAALFAISAASFLVGQTTWLVAAATAMTIVQAFDALIGTTIQDRMKVFGPAVIALFNLGALVWLIQTHQ